MRKDIFLFLDRKHALDTWQMVMGTHRFFFLKRHLIKIPLFQLQQYKCTDISHPIPPHGAVGVGGEGVRYGG
jgi:hypothetical protein